MKTAAIIVALLIVSVSSEAMAQETEDAIVTADINSALQLDTASAFAPTPWILDAGVNNINTSLQLRAFANVAYGVQVNADADPIKAAAGAEGRLFEYDGATAAYAAVTNHPEGGAGRFLNNNILVQEVGGPGGTAITATPATFPGVTGELTTDAAGRLHTVEMAQLVDFGDDSLAPTLGASEYRMVMTYTILPGM